MLKIQDPQGPTTKSQQPRPTGSDKENYKIQDAVFMKYIQTPGNVILSITRSFDELDAAVLQQAFLELHHLLLKSALWFN